MATIDPNPTPEPLRERFSPTQLAAEQADQPLPAALCGHGHDANCSECENDRATAGDWAAWHAQDA
jgi:hypothetical protein